MIAGDHPMPRTGAGWAPPLTAAERATLSLAGLGWGAPEIALLIALDEPAVGRAARGAIEKLGARDLPDAVQRAPRCGSLG